MIKRILLCISMFAMSPMVMAENENWYVMFGVGGADTSNDTDISGEINNLFAQNGGDQTELGIDLLGVYRPFKNDPSKLWGIAIHCDAQIITKHPNYITTGDISVFNYTIGLSGLYFPSEEHGKGVYFRGDAGLAQNMVIYGNGAQAQAEADEKMGIGGLVGIGYGLPVTKGTRLLLGANYSKSFVRGGDFSAVSFTLGGLW